MFGSFPPSPLVGLRLQSLLGPGSRHCYGIITLRGKPVTNGLENWRENALANLLFDFGPEVIASGRAEINNKLADCGRTSFFGVDSCRRKGSESRKISG